MFVIIYISSGVYISPQAQPLAHTSQSSDPGVAPAGAMAAHNFEMPKRGDWYKTKAQPITILYRIL